MVYSMILLTSTGYDTHSRCFWDYISSSGLNLSIYSRSLDRRRLFFIYRESPWSTKSKSRGSAEYGVNYGSTYCCSKCSWYVFRWGYIEAEVSPFFLDLKFNDSAYGGGWSFGFSVDLFPGFWFPYLSEIFFCLELLSVGFYFDILLQLVWVCLQQRFSCP